MELHISGDLAAWSCLASPQVAGSAASAILSAGWLLERAGWVRLRLGTDWPRSSSQASSMSLLSPVLAACWSVRTASSALAQHSLGTCLWHKLLSHDQYQKREWACTTEGVLSAPLL